MNVPAIVGMGKAVEIAEKSKTENLKIRKLRDKLIKGILESVEDCWLNGDINNRLSNNVNISFARVEGEGLLLELDRRGNKFLNRIGLFVPEFGAEPCTVGDGFDSS